VSGDPDFKAALPHWVSGLMEGLARDLTTSVSYYENKAAAANTSADAAAALELLVKILAEGLAAFLLIHPYANGNGHMARLMVWILALAHGHTPYTWPVDERPPGWVPYLKQHRVGNVTPLENLILDSFQPPA